MIRNQPTLWLEVKAGWLIPLVDKRVGGSKFVCSV